MGAGVGSFVGSSSKSGLFVGDGVGALDGSVVLGCAVVGCVVVGLEVGLGVGLGVG